MSCRGENEIYPAALRANRAQSLLHTDAPCWHWGDKSSRINTSFSSHWFAHTTSPSSHPEVLPPRWPLSVTCGRRSFIYLHIVPIHFTDWRQWHCTVSAALRCLMMSCFKEGDELNSDRWRLIDFVYFVCTVQLIFVKVSTWPKLEITEPKHNSWDQDRKPNKSSKVDGTISYSSLPSRLTHKSIFWSWE